ncbi:MAG: aminotransferase class I/II-fold pyridoxal phosphate-dependent enzyme [Chloroflexi bacterium]|nr:aminotransferase class I/II-fold pyridoxal phosphate-dependent enzyme [Chloroflexota bacterium]
MNQLVRAKRKVYRFGFGESPFPPPARIQSALGRAAHRTEYTDVAGLLALREGIAAFHHEADGYPISSEQVLVAPGTKPLLHNVMQAFQRADIFLPGPSWVSYAPQALIAGHNVIRIPTSYESRWRVLPEALHRAIRQHSADGRQKILVLNYPGNPDGLTYSRAELKALAQVLRAHKAWAISDEIYALLDHAGTHVSLASLYPERTMVSTGLSKWCGAGGWRLGALILPPERPQALYDALIGLGSETYSCASAPIQFAALAAYELNGDIQRFLAAQRRILAGIGRAIYRKLQDTGLRLHSPQGGFYLLLDFSPFAQPLAQRGISTDELLCDRLLDESGVALLPGTAFGMPAEALAARLAYVDFDGEAALQDGEDFDAHVGLHAAKMLEGIAALDAWLR